MSWKSLSLPCALCLDSQLVWALPSTHLILLPLETQALLSQHTRERNQSCGLISTTLPGSPRAKSSDNLDVLGPQRPTQDSTWTPSTAGLLHSADLNPSSLTQALTSPPPSGISDVTSGRHASWSPRAVRRAAHIFPGNPQSPQVLTSSLHRTWGPPSAHLRLHPTDQTSGSPSSLRKSGRGGGVLRLTARPGVPSNGGVAFYGTLCSGVSSSLKRGPPCPLREGCSPSTDAGWRATAPIVNTWGLLNLTVWWLLSKLGNGLTLFSARGGRGDPL